MPGMIAAAGTDVAAAPTPSKERALTPDIARGLSLLGIAVANSVVQLYGSATGPGNRRLQSGGPDHIVDGVVTVLVDNRAFCLFALLFGYGMHQLMSRQLARGSSVHRVRVILLRRCAALIVLGVAHGVLLYDGDILASYGLLGIVVVLSLTGRDSTLLLLAVAFTVVLSFLDSYDGVGDPTGNAPAGTGALAELGVRATNTGYSLFADLTVGLGLLAPMLLGVLLARRAVLDRPAEHLPLLRGLAVGGITVSVLGAIPFAVTVVTGGQTWGEQAPVLAAAQGMAGLGAGLGYPALIGLWVASRDRLPASRRFGPVSDALVATGRLSASSYLAQSVLLVPLLSPAALGLGGRLTSWSVMVLAVGVWVVTVVGSMVLERWGVRGPAEWFLRRVGYGTG
jgi:uncharacterized protein